MLIGYARVSTESQKLEPQLDALKKAGIEDKFLFTDKSSGAKAERPGLDEMLSILRSGDTVVVWKMDRIARSLRHLFRLVEEFKEKEINFKSITEPTIDTTSAHGRFMLSIFGAVAEFERELIRERTKAGLNSARRKGKVLGRKIGLSKIGKQKAKLADYYYWTDEKEYSINGILEETGIRSTKTLYKYLEIEGRRVCAADDCNKIFKDKEQAPDKSYCKLHKNNKNEKT